MGLESAPGGTTTAHAFSRERKGVIVLVTITGERLPEAEHSPEPTIVSVAEVTLGDATVVPPAVGPKRSVAGTWVYVMVAGLFALFAFVAGSGF